MIVQSFRYLDRQPESGLVSISTDIWKIEASECICYRPPIQPRYNYSIRAVVIRLQDGSLFIISPIPLNEDIREDIDRLGKVKYLISPNQIHHLYLGEWSQAYPDAKIYASPGLVSKRQDLTFEKTLSSNVAEPEWESQIDQCVFGKGTGWFDEVVFFHRASSTIIFTDLIMDFDLSSFSAIAKITTQLNQMYQHTPRGLQLVHMFDKSYLLDSLQTFQGWQARRVIVAHSPWLCVEGKEAVSNFLNSAFDWLEPKPAIVEATIGIFKLSIMLFAIVPIHSLIVLFADIIYPRLKKTIS